MKPQNHKPVTFRAKMFLLKILLFIAAVLATVWLSSCTVTKHRSSLVSDSTAVKKLDSGSLHRNETSSKTNSDWWRETWLYPTDSSQWTTGTVSKPKPSEFITNSLPSSTSGAGGIQPVVFIREGGTKQEENKTSGTDSSWKNSIDSVKILLKTATLDKKTEVLNWWQVLLLGAGGAVAVLLISKLKLSWRSN